MEKDKIISAIKFRIKSEYLKYRKSENIDWIESAACKIYDEFIKKENNHVD